jgi:hypothetical protein
MWIGSSGARPQPRRWQRDSLTASCQLASTPTEPSPPRLPSASLPAATQRRQAVETDGRVRVYRLPRPTPSEPLHDGKVSPGLGLLGRDAQRDRATNALRMVLAIAQRILKRDADVAAHGRPAVGAIPSGPRFSARVPVVPWLILPGLVLTINVPLDSSLYLAHNVLHRSST